MFSYILIVIVCENKLLKKISMDNLRLPKKKSFVGNYCLIYGKINIAK